MQERLAKLLQPCAHLAYLLLAGITDQKKVFRTHANPIVFRRHWQKRGKNCQEAKDCREEKSEAPHSLKTLCVGTEM